jgi:predicted dehydrogenase
MKRRDFLEAGVAAGAGALLFSPQHSAAAEARKQSEPLRVALIGAGYQGRVLIAAAAGIPNIRFAAVCDIWDYSRNVAQKLLKNYGHDARPYSDCREMLEREKSLQAAIIATPDFVHAEQTNACLRAGLHVYCEKVMANSPEAARGMVRTARETGKLLQIGYERRSNPRYRHVAEKLLGEAKLPGRLTHAAGQWCHPVAEDFGWPRQHAIPADVLRRYGYGDMHEFRNWRTLRKQGSGPLADFAAHQFDVLGWFLGQTPKTVLAAGGIDFYKTHQWPDNVLAALEYETADGPVRAQCQVLTTTSDGGSGNFEHLMGEDGSIKISENPKWTKIFREPTATEEWSEWVERGYLSRKDKAPPAISAGGEVNVRETGLVESYDFPVVLDKPPHQPHLENFFDAIRGRAKLTCPADVAFRAEAVVWKTYAALDARKLLSFDAGDFVA